LEETNRRGDNVGCYEERTEKETRELERAIGNVKKRADIRGWTRDNRTKRGEVVGEILFVDMTTLARGIGILETPKLVLFPSNRGRGPQEKKKERTSARDSERRY